MRDLHELTIKKCAVAPNGMYQGIAEVELDRVPLAGVTGYEIKCSAAGTTELTLKLIVRINSIEI